MNPGGKNSALFALRWRWLVVAVASACVHLLAYGVLRPGWPDAGRWGLAVVPFGIGGLWLLWRALPLNRQPGEAALLPTLGWGTGVTLVRGLALALVAGFLFTPCPGGKLAWLPALLYSAAAAADYLDGYLARKTGHTTVLGMRLDLELDSVGILIASLLAVRYGQLPLWYLAVGLARYLFVFGIWWQRRQGNPVFDLGPSRHRRLFAGFQMGFLSAALWPIVPVTATHLAAPLAAAAILLGFLRDWSVVSGRLDPITPLYRRVHERLSILFFVYTPRVLRAALGVSVWLLGRGETEVLRPAGWELVLKTWGVVSPSRLVPLLVLLALLGTATLLVGVVGRAGALLVAVAMCVELTAHGAQGVSALALVCCVGLLLLGTGEGRRPRGSDGGDCRARDSGQSHP